jgi:hypothetical protein
MARRTALGLGLLLAAAVGCGGGGDEGDERKAVTEKPPVKRPPRQRPAEPRVRTAFVGEPVVVEGAGAGLRLEATLVRVLDPLRVGRFDRPPRGSRLVGVELVLRNVGRATYADAPAGGATLLTTRDEEATPTLVSGGACGGAFSAYTTLRPGARRRGCIPFEVRRRARLEAFELALEAGYGRKSGKWSLRRRPAGAAAPGRTF